MAFEVIIYGCGNRGKSIIGVLSQIGWNVICAIDRAVAEENTFIYGVPVYNIDKIVNFHDSNVCIALADSEAVISVESLLRKEYSFVGEYIDYFQLLFSAYHEYTQNNNMFSKNNNNKRLVVFDSVQGFLLGGVEAWIRDLAPSLEGMFDVQIITNDEKTYEDAATRKMLIKLQINKNEFWGISNFNYVYNYLLNSRPCTLIVNNTDVFMIAAIILKQKYPNDYKLISVIHQGEEEYYNVNAMIKEEADEFIGVSKDIISELVKRGINENKCHSMTCPVYVPAYNNRSYSIRKIEPLKIGYAGRLVIRKKRIDLMTNLIEELEKQDINYNLFIAGEGKDENIINDFIVANGLNNKIRLLGYIPRNKLPLFWNNIDICINISDCEGRCISRLEAMAMGCVPIVTNVAGVNEDIVNGQNGYVVNVGDMKTMAMRIRDLYDNREQLAIMGVKSHISVKMKCQRNEHISFWKKLLK